MKIFLTSIDESEPDCLRVSFIGAKESDSNCQWHILVSSCLGTEENKKQAEEQARQKWGNLEIEWV